MYSTVKTIVLSAGLFTGLQAFCQTAPTLVGGKLGMDVKGYFYFWVLNPVQPDISHPGTLLIEDQQFPSTCDKSLPTFQKLFASGSSQFSNHTCVVLLPESLRESRTYPYSITSGGVTLEEGNFNPTWNTNKMEVHAVQGAAAGNSGEQNILCIGACNYAGKAGDDSLWGSPQADTLKGNNGHDIIHGGEGNDKIYTGLGDDLITPGPGSDKVYFSYPTDQPETPQDHDFVLQDMDADEILCELEKPNQCIDIANHRILLFPSGSTLSLMGAFASQSQIQTCLTEACQSVSVLFPGHQVRGTNSSQSSDSIVMGTSTNDLMVSSGTNNSLLRGGEGNDIFLIYGQKGHHVVQDSEGTNRVHCLNTRVKIREIDRGLRIEWHQGSLNIPNHSLDQFQTSGALNTNCEVIL